MQDYQLYTIMLFWAYYAWLLGVIVAAEKHPETKHINAGASLILLILIAMVALGFAELYQIIIIIIMGVN